MSRDEEGPPLGPLPEVEIPIDEDTDPVPFRDIERSDSEVTKRRCANCGSEIGPDEGAMRRGEIAAYEKLYEFLVRQNVSPVSAARTIEMIRKS